MAQYVYPNAAELELVNLLKVPFATCTISLVKAQIALTSALTLAELTAIEADFTGYAAITLTSIPAAYYDPRAGGISQALPLEQFNTASPYAIGNGIWGGWLQDAGGALLAAWQTAQAWDMSGVGDALPVQLVLNFFGTGSIYVSYGDIVQ